MRELLNRDKENDRPRYTTYDLVDQGGREMFDSIEEASGYRRELCGRKGTLNKRTAWFKEIRLAIESRVPQLPEEGWDLESAGTLSVASQKEELECASPWPFGELLVEACALPAWGRGICISGDLN